MIWMPRMMDVVVDMCWLGIMSEVPSVNNWRLSRVDQEITIYSLRMASGGEIGDVAKENQKEKEQI